MAQLRCINTSDVVFEGTPLECVLAAQKLGGAIVLEAVKPGTKEIDTQGAELAYDDVGLGFDPDTVLNAAEENAAGLEGAAAEAKGNAAKSLGAHAKRAREALSVDTKALSDARRTLEAVRVRQDKALRAGG